METARPSRSVLTIVFFTVFLDLIGFGLIIPIAPFFAQTFSATPLQITLLGACYSLMQFIFAPFWGKLSDRYGRRPIILTSICFGAVGCLLFGFANSLIWLYAARLLAGFGNANIAVAQAVITDVTTSENRAKGMGLIGAAFGLGFILGPAIGGFFSRYGLAVPAFIAAGLQVANLLSALVLLPETKPKAVVMTATSHAPLSLKALSQAFALPFVGFLLIIFAAYSLSFSMMEQVIALFIQHFWLPGATGSIEAAKEAARLTSGMLVCVGVTATIIQGRMIGPLVKRFGENKLLWFGYAVTGASIAALTLAGHLGSYALLLGLSVLIAAGSAVANTSVSSLISKLAPIDNRGLTLGLSQSLASLGRVFGPVSAGLLFEANPSLPFLVGGSLIMICSGFAFVRILPLDPTRHTV